MWVRVKCNKCQQRDTNWTNMCIKHNVLYIFIHKVGICILGYATLYENILPLGVCFLSFCYEIGKILNISCCAALVVVCGQLPNHIAHFRPQCTAPPEGEKASYIFLSEFIGITTIQCDITMQYNASVTSGPVRT